MKTHFSESERFYCSILDSSHSGRMIFISFMLGWLLYKRELQGCMLGKLTVQVEKIHTGEELQSGHRERMDFISFIGG